jgi:predicted peptidase
MKRSRSAPRPGRQTLQRFAGRRPPAPRLNYLLFLPASYDADPRRRWPLLLFLHGSGERGGHVRQAQKHGPPSLVARQPDFPFILVSPHCPAHRVWEPAPLLALLDHVMNHHRVNRRRVYLTGMSMGAYGGWQLVAAQPQRFAAFVPVCGGGDVLPLLLAPPARERALRSLPVWAFHGARDELVPVAESERMLGAMRHLGATDVRLTVYPEAGHDAWTQTYANPKLYEWLLAQRRTRG